MLEIIGSKHQKECHDKDLFCQLTFGYSGRGHSAITVGINIPLIYSFPRHRQFWWLLLGLSQQSTGQETKVGILPATKYVRSNWVFWNWGNDHMMDLLWDEAQFHKPQLWMEGFSDTSVSLELVSVKSQYPIISANVIISVSPVYSYPSKRFPLGKAWRKISSINF